MKFLKIAAFVPIVIVTLIGWPTCGYLVVAIVVGISVLSSVLAQSSEGKAAGIRTCMLAASLLFAVLGTAVSATLGYWALTGQIEIRRNEYMSPR